MGRRHASVIFCQASVFLYISPSDSLPALTDNSKSSLGYPWFLGTQTFLKNLFCSKIKSTLVMKKMTGLR